MVEKFSLKRGKFRGYVIRERFAKELALVISQICKNACHYFVFRKYYILIV